MHLYEYQAKQLLGRYGVQVPIGQVAASSTEAIAAARRLGCARYAVKAQVLAGNRLANNGIAFASTPEQVGEQTERMLREGVSGDGAGSTSHAVHQVYVEEFVEGAREIYASVAIDRASGQIMLMTSAHGGEDLEARALAEPGIINKTPLRLVDGKPQGDFKSVAVGAVDGETARTSLSGLFRDLASALMAYDATLIEINPLAVMADGRLIALDAKMSVDDNALYRRPALAAMRQENDRISSDKIELEAQRFQINYLGLDGDIGIVCNGAGLALVSLDMVHDAGGRPANFMDIRTTASSLDIAHGFGLLLQNSSLKAILVNVHGGGMQRCDTIAEGIGIALRRQTTNTPIIIRMAGNNADFARTVLNNNGVNYIGADDMGEAVRRAVSFSSKQAA